MISKRSRTLQSAKYLHKKRKKSFLTAALLAGCALIFIIAAVLALRLSFFRISHIEVYGTTPAYGESMKEMVVSVLDGDYFHLIPKSNSFLYPKRGIERKLLDSYIQIDSLRVSRKNFSTLEIDVIERIPQAVVCNGFRGEESDDCFFADKNGYIYKESPGFSDGVYSRYYMQSDDENLSLGRIFITSSKFKELQHFLESLKGNGLSPLGILVADAGSYELYVKNRDESAAVIYFDDRTPFDTTLSNLVAFWDNAMNKKIGTSTIPAFDYINLRFGNNIFYSFK